MFDIRDEDNALLTLAFIESFELRTSLEGSTLRLDALFQKHCNPWPDREGLFTPVVLQFDGVRNLSLMGFGGGPRQVMGFEVVDVSKDQLEGIRYSVGDYEDDRISFFCQNVQVVSKGDERPLRV